MSVKKIIAVTTAVVVGGLVIVGCGGEKKAADAAQEIAAADGAEDNTFTDQRDGKKYRMVTIGEQTWMAENLNYDTADGVGSWCYDNNPDNCAKYGRLYNWETAMKACPAGWRLPSDDDLNVLTNIAGGTEIAGTMLKSKDWESKSGVPVATDAFGFSALPGGELYMIDGNDIYLNVGANGGWWSATEIDSNHVYLWRMFRTGEWFSKGKNGKIYASSVRCIKGMLF